MKVIKMFAWERPLSNQVCSYVVASYSRTIFSHTTVLRALVLKWQSRTIVSHNTALY